MQTKHFREALDILREGDPGEQDEKIVSLLGCSTKGLVRTKRPAARRIGPFR